MSRRKHDDVVVDDYRRPTPWYVRVGHWAFDRLGVPSWHQVKVQQFVVSLPLTLRERWRLLRKRWGL